MGNPMGVGGTGFEPPAKLSEKTPFASTGGAESGALGSEIDSLDPGLAEVVKAWPTLPEAVRADILAMVRAAGSGANAQG
jgi:hypothetical protein